MCQYCFIVPKDVLIRLSEDKTLSEAARRNFADTATLDTALRKVRVEAAKMAQVSHSLAPSLAAAVAAQPVVTVFDCHHGQTLPGVPVPNPGSSADATAKRANDTAQKVAQFYRDVFGRNSIDGSGMTIMSSVHFRTAYQNAFWNGTQMAYGDGDGALFIDFTLGNDVIGHELTHGVTQFSLQLNYSNDAGGINESMSDVFGSMFRQWLAGQTVTQADWLIGSDIMGPQARARGYTCLRDMAYPAAKHCLAAQPTTYAQVTKGMDPHYSSGIPNLAFTNAAKAIGGKSWEKAGKIWYQALTGFGPSPRMTMKRLAARTRTLAGQMFTADPAVAQAVDRAWKGVGL